MARLLLSLGLLFISTLSFADELKLVNVTPQGEDVLPPSQIVFEFDRNVVPLGRMERSSQEVPIEISPALNCEWRWIDQRSLACYLNHSARPSSATRYQITVRPGLRALDQAQMAKEATYSFLTSRARVQYYWFQEWSAPGVPTINLSFSDEIDKASAEQHLYFAVEGKRIPLALWQPEGYAGQSTFLASPTIDLPLGKTVELRVEPGVKNLSGGEPSSDNRVIVEFQTFPEFRFLGVQCAPNKGVQMLLSSLDAARIACNSLAEVSLVFSSPVMVENLKKGTSLSPNPFIESKDPWSSVSSYSRRYGPVAQNGEYAVPLPFGLKAATEYRVALQAQEIRDEFGRSLSSDVSAQFRTDDRLPRLVIPSTVSTLESGEETHLPMAVQNLHGLSFRFDRFTSGGLELAQNVDIPVDYVHNVSYYFPLRLRKFLGGRSSGVVFGHVSSPELLGPGSTVLSQVSPYALHLKQGHRNTHVWVTSLVTGKPLGGVKVEARKLFTNARLDGLSQPLAVAETDSDGVAVLPGTAVLDPQLTAASYLLECADSCEKRMDALVYTANGSEGVGFISATSEYELYPYSAGREYLGYTQERANSYLKTWGMTAQGVYRLGDTVQFKLFVRDEGNATLEKAPSGSYSVRVVDPLGGVVAEFQNVSLSAFGTFSGEFLVPATGAVGSYRFELKPSFTDQTFYPLEVLVSDFTPAPFKVASEVRDPRPVSVGSPVSLTSQASLYAGGPYTRAKYRFVSRVQSGSFPDLPSQFSGFYFDLGEYHFLEENFAKEGVLDGDGKAEVSFQVQPSSIVYGTLRLETAVSDDRGRSIATEETLPFAGRPYYVGLRTSEWLMTKGRPFTIEGAVVDRSVRPAPGQKFEIDVFRIVRTANRIKGPGNAFITQYDTSEEFIRKCELTSGEKAVGCTIVPTFAGEYRFVARVGGEGESSHQTSFYSYCRGSDDVVWDTEEGNTLDIISEKKSYRVGDTAKFLVKNPLPGARALITVERIGTIQKKVVVLKDAVSVVSLPVTEEMIPGFYLSVVLHSPRVEKPLEGEADLGKPLAKMGYTRVEVVDGRKELLVQLKSKKEEYRPKDTVSVELQVSAPKGGRALEQTEVGVAVVDEAVFDLLRQGMSAYDPSRGLYRFGMLDVRNFNDLLTLVGRRKFEKKGANSGGDGGSEVDLREVEKYVAYWAPNVALGADGKGSFTFTAPENLTAWKVIAVAATKSDRFGVGSNTFRVNQPLEVRSALPNFAREGDSFVAKFTLLNRTKTVRRASFTLDIDGPLKGERHFATEVTLPPFERTVVSFPVHTETDGTLRFQARASGGEDFQDGLQVRLPVKKNYVLETVAHYGTTLSALSETEILFPGEIRSDVGELSATLSPSVIANLDGAFAYMRDYPYSCWEQRLTKAIMAAHYRALKGYLSLDWPESESIIQETLAAASRFQAPNGGMGYYGGSDDRVEPYLSAFSALGLNWLKELGYEPPADVERRLHEYLRQMLSEDVFPTFYSTGMASSVRAVALQALSARGVVGLADVERFAGAVPQMKLFGKSQFLMAARNVGASEKLLADVTNQIRAHGVQSASKFVFSETLADEDNRILASNLRENCVVLSALIAAGADADMAAKLVTHISESRKQSDRWENTQENLFCSRALIEYARRFESISPNYQVVVRVGDRELGTKRFESLKDLPVVFSSPMVPEFAGNRLKVLFEKAGEGRLYHATRLSYVEKNPKRGAVNSGLEVVREYSVERNGVWEFVKGPLRPGELVRVDLYVVVPTARNFVVVDDPVPAGFEPVNRELKTSSLADADKAQFQGIGGSYFYRYDDWLDYGASFWSFYHKELRHDSARFYSEYLPAGRYHLSYVLQGIGAGEFDAPPTRALEMYHPETYGRSVWTEMSVAE